MAATLQAGPVTYATAREALEAAFGIPVPPAADLTIRPLLSVFADHHRDGPEGYEAEQLAGAAGDVAIRAAAVTGLHVVQVATIVRHPHLAGDLLRVAAGPTSSVVVAAAWRI